MPPSRSGTLIRVVLRIGGSRSYPENCQASGARSAARLGVQRAAPGLDRRPDDAASSRAANRVSRRGRDRNGPVIAGLSPQTSCLPNSVRIPHLAHEATRGMRRFSSASDAPCPLDWYARRIVEILTVNFLSSTASGPTRGTTLVGRRVEAIAGRLAARRRSLPRLGARSVWRPRGIVDRRRHARPALPSSTLRGWTCTA